MAIEGRPTVMTPEVIRKLEESFLMGCTDLEACLYADISKTALYEYQKDNPEFTERKEKLKENPIFQARRSVLSKLSDDADLALKFLERKKKDEFSLRHETDTTIKGDKDNPVLHNHTGKVEMGAELIAQTVERLIGK
jgi:hypothetical protein